MRNHTGWRVRLTLGLLGVLLLILTACDEVNDGTPAPIPTDGQVVLNLPTRTLPPVVSETPRFTATPIPSSTPIPSVTPTPTPIPPTLTKTPTPTPTLTPTVSGEVQSARTVNLRSGPGIDYDVVAVVPPGTQIGVIGIQTDETGADWFKIVYTDDDGETSTVWVLAALVDTDYKAIVGLDTPEPGTGTPRPAPTREPRRVNVLAYCAQKGAPAPSPTVNDEVFIEWSWYVRQEDLMDQHLEHATYEVNLDGEPLDDWERYGTAITLDDLGRWIIYWNYPVGQLSPGTHVVEFKVTWDEAITDGYDDFGPGTPNEADIGNCTFTVTDN